jgi:hypothetical protein
MKKFSDYLKNDYDPEWKKDYNNSAYDDGTHNKIGKHGARVWTDDKDLEHREDDKPAFIDYQSKIWHKHGKIHREYDKPAFIRSDGKRMWYKNDEKHRSGDNPAVIYSDGQKEWYRNGLAHRSYNRPAVTSPLGISWYTHGQWIMEPDFKHHLAALEDDLNYINHFPEKFKENIPEKLQEKIINYDSSFVKYLVLSPKLKQKYGHIEKASKFGFYE